MLPLSGHLLHEILNRMRPRKADSNQSFASMTGIWLCYPERRLRIDLYHSKERTRHR